MNIYGLVLFLAVVIASPSVQAEGDAIANTKRIVGAWSAQEADVINDITYLGDGTFRGRLLNAATGVAFWNYEGKWAFKGNLLWYSYTKSDSERVGVGYRNHDKVLELDAEHFMIRTSTGEERTYTRVRK